MNHLPDCRFPDDETFKCNRCGTISLFCCGCGGQDGEGDNAPPLCLTCGADYYREREEAEREADAAAQDKFRAEEKAVTDAVDAVQDALRDRGVTISGVKESTLSSSRYFFAGGFKVRVSDHAINPYGGGFWKDDGTELHSQADFELIVPPHDGEIENLADRIADRVRRDREDEEE